MKIKIFQEKMQECLKTFPGNAAIEYGQRIITYAELDEKSHRAANWILGKGIEKETFIGVLMGSRIDFIISMLAVFKAGCIFVPLDPALPRSRIDTMIKTLNMKIIIIDALNESKFNTGYIDKKQEISFFIYNEIIKNSRGSTALQNKNPGFTPEDKIYVYFTSGSTGKPNAVLGKSKSLLNYIEWEVNEFKIRESWRLSQLATPIFDAFLKEVFVTFFAGATLCIPGSLEEILTPGTLKNWLETYKITLMHCVPPVFRLLNSDKLTQNNLFDLKYILISGAKIVPADLKRWYAVFTDRIQLYNLYGTTETTILSTYYPIRQEDVTRQTIPIGRFIKGTRILILNKDMGICEDLISGEIYIRTPYRTFGYYNDPKLNKQRFIKNPFNNDPNDLLFKTGDIGRYLPDGNVELLGRIDRQVKIRGIRVELEEIESVLIGHHLVTDACVIKKEIANGNEMLWAYATLDKNRVYDDFDVPGELKNYLAKELPKSIIPDHIMILEELPRNPSGKVAFDSLPDPQENHMGIILPQNAIQEKLHSIWSEVLNIESLAINKSFFELGGNSLNVMMLITKVHKEFDVRFSIGEIFNNDTIEKQAALVEKSAKITYTSIKSAEKQEYYPLSSAQKRLYFIHQMESVNVSYNSPGIVILEGSLITGKLEKITARIIKRHECLRTYFTLVDDLPVQIIDNKVSPSIEYFTLKEEEVKEITREFIRPFDISKAPLYRIGLIRINETRNFLMVDMHHIICDAVSFIILVKDFVAIYNGQELPLLKLQYKDFSMWQNHLRETENLKKQENYWLRVFAGNVPVLDMPTDYPRPEIQGFEGDYLCFAAPPLLSHALNDLAIKTGATLFMILLTVYQVLLSKYTTQEDIVVGATTAGRRNIELDGVIGMFVNMLAIRCQPGKHKSFREFLAEVKKNVLDAMEHQDYQLEEIVAKINIPRDASRNPLFDVVFTMFNIDFANPNDNLELEDSLKIRYPQEEPELKNSKFDLLLFAYESSNKLDFRIEFSAKLFKKSTIEKFANHYIEILEQVVENSDIKLNQMELSYELTSLSADEYIYNQDDFGF